MDARRIVSGPVVSGPGRRVPAIVSFALTALVIVPLAGQPVAGQTTPGEKLDFDAIYKIKDEGLNRSQVMETLSYLTDVHGPRLTNSPGMRSAAAWTKERLTKYGLEHVAFEAWGPFGRGWVNERLHVQMVTPQPFPLLAFPKAWTPGTNGPVKGEVVQALLEKEEDLAKWQGKLKGKFVLVSPLRDVRSFFESPVRRYSDRELADLAKQPVGQEAAMRRRFAALGPQGAATELRRKRMEFLVKEGALAILELSPGDRGDNGAVRVQGPMAGEGSREKDAPTVLPQVVIAAEHYGRIARLLDKKVPVTVELDVRNRFIDDDLNVFNIVGEIPGTDKKDELVMIGAHFDSWHSGTGATDNGVSSAVMIEAMRILKATGLQPRRTIRIALWTGEEQGLLGSRAYVKDHFADRETMAVKPEHGRLSVYLNMDNGGGAFRGVYLQGNEAVAPIFEAWMRPFSNLGLTTHDDPAHGRHRSPVVRRGGPAGLPVHPGSARVQHADAPHEPGRLRARDPRGPDAERGRDCVLRVPRRDPRRAPPAQAAAQADAAARPRRPDSHAHALGVPAVRRLPVQGTRDKGRSLVPCPSSLEP